MRNESGRERGERRSKDRGASFEPDPSERARHVGREIDELSSYHCLRSGLTPLVKRNFSKPNLRRLFLYSFEKRKILEMIKFKYSLPLLRRACIYLRIVV